MKTLRARLDLVLFAALMVASNHLAERTAARDRQGIYTPGDAAGFHLSVMHIFRGGTDGANGSSPLIRLSDDGNFYGVTDEGGSAGFGTLFRMTPAGITTIIHTFTNGADGGSPIGALFVTVEGVYGTTFSGGNFGLGTIYRIDSDDGVTFTFETVHHFAGGSDGARPRAALIQAPDGNFYGTTRFGGASNRGTIFRMSPAPANTVTVLYSFSGAADGAYPYAPLVRGTDGNFYGTVYAGDTGTFGRVFRMTPAGVVTVMHTFTGGADGGSPLAGLIQATDGNFYGTTSLGGAANKGTLFRITPAGVLTTLKTFDDSTHGGSPDDDLIQGSDGNLYGVAKTGAAGYGVAFQMTLGGIFTVIHIFTGGGDGANPSSALLQAPDGSLYGSTSFGGGVGKGIVYRISNAPAAPFTDPTLTPGSILIKAVHITELRTRIDAIRAKFDLPAYSYTDPTLTAGTTMVKAVHVYDLRVALNQAFDAAALSKPTYTDSVLTGVFVKAAHINELRNAVIDLE